MLSRIDRLEVDYAAAQAVIARQAARIAELEGRLRLNSRTSSKPPSSDGPDAAPPQRSLRTKSGKSPGGQVGHRGTTLEAVEAPDDLVDHLPRACARCGEGLFARPPELASRHQVFDVPPVRVHVTEHRVYRRTCGCGHVTTAGKPAGLPACPTSYGRGVGALVAYFSARHYLPVARLAELVTDVLGTPIATGTVAAMLERSAAGLAGVVAGIKARIATAAVVGADETTIRESIAGGSGRRAYAWVWHTARFAYLARGPGRGADVHRREFPGGFPNAVLVSDRLAAQLNTPSAAGQVCIPHIQRTVNGLSERPGASPWLAELGAVLRELTERGRIGHAVGEGEFVRIRDALAGVLHAANDARLSSAREVTLRRELAAVAERMLVCLVRRDVPPDNNGAERVIRNLKVKLKVSGQWRSGAGTEAYLALRSVIETAVKQGLRPLDVLRDPGLLSY